MTLKRIAELSRTEASRIRARQNQKTMSVYFDDENYMCFDLDEYNNWKSKKVGRKPKFGG